MPSPSPKNPFPSNPIQTSAHAPTPSKSSGAIQPATPLAGLDLKPLQAGTADLNNIANIELQIGQSLALGPGEVTPGQKMTLAKMAKAGNSTWAQYYQQAGLSQFASDPEGLVQNQVLTSESMWSALDMQSGLKALGVAGKDEIEVIKEKMAKQNEIGGLVEMVAGAAMMFFLGWTGVGAVAGAGLIAEGSKTMKSGG